MLTISFLVPTLGNRIKELKRLLNSLEQQTIVSFEIVIVVQDNYEEVKYICNTFNNLKILCIKSEKRGLSINRNIGLSYCSGEIIVLSDDDCWYPENAVQNISKEFKNEKVDVVLTKIYDVEKEQEYKKYDNVTYFINSKIKLMSRSSIEIAFRNNIKKVGFDESFGLGAYFVCGEEIDFLLKIYENGYKIKYVPIISVYHPIKICTESDKTKRIIAKGALYAKHYNFVVGILVVFRDLLLKRENNFLNFCRGYNEFSKRMR